MIDGISYEIKKPVGYNKIANRFILLLTMNIFSGEFTRWGCMPCPECFFE